MTESRNLILYGPPGTGKTYRSSALAVQIIAGLSSSELQAAYPTRLSLRERLEKHRRDGRMAFIVFHPSLSYEDFVEGIKPRTNEQQTLSYAVEDGIFKQLCVRAAHALYLAQQTNALAATPPTRHHFEALFFEFVDYLQRTGADEASEMLFESKTGKTFYLVNINTNHTLILKPERGTQEYAITRKSLATLYRKFDSAEAISNLRRDMPAALRGNASVAWAVFNRLKHYEATRDQSYYHLLGGHTQHDAVRYQAMKRDVHNLDYASLTPEDRTTAGNFVLVIDEINRGNVAAIFGELIALIEDDKRAGEAEALQTVLPYSREPFSVPPNLYLVGTMNTADRSLEALDTALRRRFAFEAVEPDPALLSRVVVTEGPALQTGAELSRAAEPTSAYRRPAASLEKEIDLEKLLRTINRRLVSLLDAEHQIGHGYFMSVGTAPRPLDELRVVFFHKLIPLLEEFFFGETDKVILVIGSDFFSADISSEADDRFFAESDSEAEWTRMSKKFYRVRSLADSQLADAIRAIYE
jgi:5-methylcytosine-specific restriction protein B